MAKEPFDGTWTNQNAPRGWHVVAVPCESCKGTGQAHQLVPKRRGTGD